MQLTLYSTTIWLATQPVDFRKSVNGLCEIIQANFSMDLKKNLFIFYNRNKQKLKIITWHKNGFVLIYKRLEKGRFRFCETSEKILPLDEKQLSWLLAGLEWSLMSEWDKLSFDNYF